MKRKRFVKLAMSYGVQRNEAGRLAKLVCVLGSYEGVFAHYRLPLSGRGGIGRQGNSSCLCRSQIGT
ncbi:MULTISPECIES: hypothetical protein, partial [unclassified Neglectibacter]|uniref:hypothetical protein n=1 Tax=unclassified Neglectibacter TaxID=2632164 RepID=UPI001A9B7765